MATKNNVEISDEEIRVSQTFGDDLLKKSYSGGTNFGATSSIGIRYQHTSNIVAKIGVKGVFQDYKPQQREITTFIERDTDKLTDLTYSSILTLYVEEITIDSNSPVNSSQPSQALQISFPFNSLGLEVSLGYLFGK